MAGLLMNFVAGRLLDAGFGYGTVFNIVGTLHVIAFAVILIGDSAHSGLPHHPDVDGAGFQTVPGAGDANRP
jgi:hypothetical protein